MRFINVVGNFPQEIDYMVSEAKRLKDEVGLEEVALSLTLHPEGKPAFEKPLMYQKVFREYKSKLEGTGIKVGILLQSLIGHGWLGGACCEEGWQRAENINKIPVDRSCILDEGFRNYIYETVKLMASEKPYALLVDDDFRQIDGHGLECFCPAHMAQFNEGLERQYSADELREILRNAKPGDELLTRFDNFRRNNLLGLARLVRAAIDAVAPEINCGYCTPGMEFLLAGEVSQILAGTHKPYVRFNNANYLEGDAKDFPYNVYLSSMLRQVMPQVEDFIDEADTFPQNRYSKAAKSMHAKLVSAALNREIGAKLWLTNLGMPDSYTERKYDEIMAKYRNFYIKLFDLMVTATPEGVVTPLPKIESITQEWHPVYFRNCFYKEEWQFKRSAHFGIPGCYGDLNKSGIKMVSGDMLRFFDDDEVRLLLSGKVLLDGSAVVKLARRGFAAAMGIKVEEKPFRASCEVSRFNGDSMIFMNDFKTPFITVATTQTEVLSEMVFERFRGAGERETVCCGSTYYKNESGGEVVAVCEHLGMNFQVHPKRRRHLINMLEKLNGGALEVIVECDQNVLARQFKLPDGSLLLGVFNLNFDELENITLNTNNKLSKVEYLDCNGAWQELAAPGNIVPISLQTYDCAILKLS